MSELEQARETIRRLNRRCQEAEAAARVTVEECKRSGVSFGRALANWYGHDADRRIAELEALLKEAREVIPKGTNLDSGPQWQRNKRQRTTALVERIDRALACDSELERGA